MVSYAVMDVVVTQNSADSATATVEPFRVLIPSPIGVLGVELVGEKITGVTIVPIGKARKRFKPFGDLKRSERSEFLDEVVGRFSEFLAGARRNLDLDFDLRAVSVRGFTRRTLRQTLKIPYGRTRSYRQIAEAVGRPESYRQVLSILKVNPLPLVVPCHRVIPSKSGTGSYIAGARKKQWLLKMEQQVISADLEG